VYSRGELQGGSSVMLSAPMVGGNALAITFLRNSGDVVKKGDIVAQFDTTDQVYKTARGAGRPRRGGAEKSSRPMRS